MQLGVPVTFIAVMMKANYLGLANVARVAKRYEAPLRINVYQSVRSDLYALTYDEYWQRLSRAAICRNRRDSHWRSLLVRAMAGLPAKSGGCGAGTSTCHAARHHATLRLLAWRRRAAFAAALSRLGNHRDFALRGGAHGARCVPFMCVPRSLPWRVCGSPPHTKCSSRARLLLSDRPGQNRKAASLHGSRARTSQRRKRLYHHCHCPRLVLRFVGGETATRCGIGKKEISIYRKEKNDDDISHCISKRPPRSSPQPYTRASGLLSCA